MAPAPQLTEHWPVQVTAHVEPSEQVTLPLAPTVVVQSAFFAQSILQDSPQLPLQVLPSAQTREQLPAPHPVCENSQLFPAGQLQLDPVQLTGCGDVESSLPQAHTPSAAESNTVADSALRLCMLQYLVPRPR